MMSTDLKSQIHAYGAQLVDGQRPITEADIANLLGKVRELPQAPVPVREKPRPWVAVAAGLAVLVLFGGLSLFLATSGSETPPATTPSTVTSVTSPATTTSLPAEESPLPTSGNTYQELPNQSTIGWKWYETGLQTGEGVWRLRDGSYIAYSQGWDSSETQGDGSALFSEGTSGYTIADPVERFRISTDGRSWVEVPLDRFEGFGTWAHLESPGGLPYFYVSVHPLDADRDDADSWSTWATDDGENWFEVLIDGESAQTYFMEYAQIGQQAVAAGFLMSSDGGRSFDTLDPSVFGFAKGDLRQTEMFLYEGAFRTLAWNQKARDMETSMYTENPVLWESRDGMTWTVVGSTSGLEPQPDGRGLVASWGTKIESLSDGYLLLSGAQPTRATFDGGPAAYILESTDGGLTWLPVDNFPITADPDYDSLIVAANLVTTVDGWVVISTGDVTLATDGNTWIRLDMPSGDQNGVDSYGNRLTPIGIRGAVMSGWDMEWILGPSR
ncbi:MAG: hypothetical protein BMS9Abin12_2279 [Acidimicrobiia bacterium]|nr:MAG: hypothetical protein BMS9Abin12_2279 [Acidimicrobiia bacterium]